MHFVLYIPGGTGYDAEAHLAKVGLSSLHDSAIGALVSDVDEGPDGGRGVLLRWEHGLHSERNASHRTDDKTWWQDKHKNRFWIGWHAEAPPQPIDLQRNRSLEHNPELNSFPVRLEDGNTWWVPVARDLPKRYDQDPETGQQRLAEKTPFQKFWDATLDMRDRYRNGSLDRDFQLDGAFEFAVQALALNYRICAEVIYALGLFDQRDPLQIIMAAVEQSLTFERVVTVHERRGNLILEKKKPA